MATGVQTRHANGVLCGLGSAVGEEHHVQIPGSEFGDQSRGFAARIVGKCWCDGAQLGSLLLDRGDQLRVLVTDVQVDELAREVEELGAILGPEMAALGASDHDGVDERLRAPAVEHMLAVVGEGIGRIGLEHSHGVEISCHTSGRTDCSLYLYEVLVL